MKRAFAIIIPLLLVIAIIGGVFYAVTYRSEDIALVLENYADNALEEASYDKAIKYYTYAARFSPRNPSIALSLSNAYALSGNYTKAEYTLVSMISQRPDNSGLYKALSRVYVQQGKLYDAEQMLNRISDDSVRAELDALRPAAPVLSMESGSYNTHLDLTLQFESGNAFVSTTGSYPCLDEPYEDAITLTEGTTEIYALVVSDAGLVSRACYGTYTIGHVVAEVTFEDAVLDSWVRYILDLEAEQRITTDQLWEIQALYLPDGVASLNDLHFFENLAILSLHNARKIDCAPITQLKKLQTLDLSGCHLDSNDLASIGTLTSLKELYLPGCGIANLNALQALSQLKVLDLTDNSVVSISALSRLTGLTALHLSGNAITDISDLSALTELQELDLNNNLLKDTSVLSSLQNLQKLYLSGCKITDLSFISKMPELTDLDLSGNELTDVSSLAQLKQLKHLNISYNQISDIGFMADMLSLSTLNADYNEITELPYFNEECLLQNISINHNKLTDAAGVCDLFRLNLLSMDYNELTDISYLMYCTCLVEVNAFGNPLADVQDLLDTGIIINYDPTYILDHPPVESEETTDEEETEE